ncbi:MAG: cyclic pyranopterin monophosphate synthase MoaC [Pirellulaceae bacterium]|nr:cyclic pyranopterin monophosphate synthase MoaC [Pirellulaceae bacterium]
MDQLSHFDDSGASRMVDVSEKEVTQRFARASGKMRLAKETLSLIRNRNMAKGDVLEIARIAGISGAKRTADLIPLCHILPLESVEINFDFPDQETIHIEAITRITGRTGVEMEAIVAVTTTAVTIYDMCKAIDREMVIEQIQLEEKSGGRSGHFIRAAPNSIR